MTNRSTAVLSIALMTALLSGCNLRNDAAASGVAAASIPSAARRLSGAWLWHQHGKSAGRVPIQRRRRSGSTTMDMDHDGKPQRGSRRRSIQGTSHRARESRDPLRATDDARCLSRGPAAASMAWRTCKFAGSHDGTHPCRAITRRPGVMRIASDDISRPVGAMAPARGLENSAWYPFSNPYSSAALPGRHGFRAVSRMIQPANASGRLVAYQFRRQLLSTTVAVAVSTMSQHQRLGSPSSRTLTVIAARTRVLPAFPPVARGERRAH